MLQKINKQGIERHTLTSHSADRKSIELDTPTDKHALSSEITSMSDNMRIRASRDGDQFHYLWAARRLLHLLTPQSELVSITIEGASPSELQAAGKVDAGEELIDIAEYYGSTAIEKATLIRYMQLKHSTLRVDDVWQPSGLEKTLTGFAERYSELRRQLPAEQLQDKIEFWFVTNRRINTSFVEAAEDAGMQRASRHESHLKKLTRFTSLEGAELARFCRMLRFDGRQDDYWTQRNILSREVSGYLPGPDVDAPMRLKELVTRKALSESSSNPAVTKIDVLRALQTDEADLFPAPCLIKRIDNVVPREQEPQLVSTIVGAIGRPVIVHADSGVGKSILSTRIGINLADGSISVLYDCFGNGQYRSASGYRHRHRTALVQIANELSALSLCHPLIPIVSADASAYMRAFVNRLTQSASILRARKPDALLCIVVDAADNAQLAADEIGEPHSFVRDLLRETLPDGVRLVVLCRPHREAMLNPPANALSVALNAFSLAETTVHLRGRFPDATEHDVIEFHRLSSRNPRVQALALVHDAPLPEVLRLLGPNPTTVEGAIGAILEKSIAKLRDAAGQIQGAQVDLICAGLAVLRPLIPISVLAAMSGVDETAIKSFALDLGRPLIVTDNTIQFFDEPAETWFRKRFRPDADSIKEFVDRLKEIASSSAYVAAALPQLMLGAGQFSELVELALTSTGLPETNPVERRDVELQRLQFALKASLRGSRYADAAKLALKAGGETAGDGRQRGLLQDNIDVVAVFMDSNGVQELVSRRTFGSGWVGSHHVYDAAVLSSHGELVGEARSRLRMAEEWLRNWSKLTPDEREAEDVSDEDRAVMAIAHFNIHGADAAARSLRAWRPRELSYSAGRIVARRFLDHGRYGDLDELAVSANNDIGLLLALAVEARHFHRLLPRDAVGRGFKLLSSRRISVKGADLTADSALSAVTAMVETAYLHGLCDAEAGKTLLERYLPATPPRSVSSRHSGMRAHYMRAYSLRAAFGGTPLELIDVATHEFRTKMGEGKQYGDSGDLRDFKQDIGALLPWYNLWARVVLRRVSKAELPQAIAIAKAASSEAGKNQYREESFTSDEIAGVWIDILFDAGGADGASIGAILEWSGSLSRQLYTPTLNRLAHLSARTSDAGDLAFRFAQTASSLLRDERTDAQNKAEGYVEIARSILSISRSEAEAYFDQAVEVASKIGDENLGRWDALIELAERAARADHPSPKIAYRFARCAEVTWDYSVRDKHFPWRSTVEALTRLCPSSSFAIISRWRDRRFGRNDRVLGLAIESLREQGRISALDALALIGFGPEWDGDKLIEDAVAVCGDTEAKTAALHLFYRYATIATVEEQSATDWRRLGAIAESAGVHLPDVEARMADSEADEAARENARSSDYGTTALETKAEGNWDEVFSRCDLTTASGLSLAHQRFNSSDPPFYSNVFFRSAIERVPFGKEAEFVAAFGAVVEFDLYHLRALLEAFPPQWKSRLSIRASLATTLKVFCHRFCMSIVRSRYYETIPMKLACELSGVGENELLDVIVAGIGESTEFADHDRLFSLVGLLSSKLTSKEALDVLSYGLDLFDVVLEDTDGDGPWKAELAPPPAVEDSLAGYIWAGLASPVAAIRWEAAHVVFGLSALGSSRVIAGLMNHASANTAKPFGDPRFTFYSLHAQQWLLIASARAALDDGEPLVPHADHFLARATVDEPHVLIRLFAARTVLALADQDLLTLPTDVRQELLDINASPIGTVRLDPSQDDIALGASGTTDEELPESDRYFFGIDFGPYWLQPLGRCFGMSQSETELAALRALRGDLGYTGTGRWDEDERLRRRLYQGDGTYSSHGAYPRVDDHGFYLSYHAMLVTAGKLLATKPIIENEWEDDPFLEILARHDISRADGRWLADRRDPQPRGRPYWLEDDSRDEWLGSIEAADFERVLYPSAGYMTVSGHWSDFDTSREERISVYTALVSREASASLLRALQTAANPHDFRLPDARDHFEIDHGRYQLRGWIVDQPSERGIDACDRWAGDVRFPPPAPAPFVVEKMGLTSDPDLRLWQGPADPAPKLQSDVWRHFSEKYTTERPTGRRLQASVQFVVQFLKAIGMDLVVEVDIHRQLRRQSYEGRDSDESPTIRPSTKIFIFKHDGTVDAL